MSQQRRTQLPLGLSPSVVIGSDSQPAWLSAMVANGDPLQPPVQPPPRTRLLCGNHCLSQARCLPPVRRPLGGLCVTREPLSTKFLRALRALDFIELHKFLPTSLLQATAGIPAPCSCCHTCYTTQAAGDKHSKTIGDIFTWLKCFHHFTAAELIFHPGKASEFMAYANTILHTYSARMMGEEPMTGLSACRWVASQQPIGLSSNCPCMPSSSRCSHAGRIPATIAAAWTTKHLMPWGVDVATSSSMAATPAQYRTLGRGHPQTISFPGMEASANFMHCATLGKSAQAATVLTTDCPSWSSRRQAPGSHLSEGQRRPQTEEPPVMTR